MSLKILITGGLGFLGQHVVDVFRFNGHSVTVVDNVEPTCGGERRLANTRRYEYRNTDITDPKIFDLIGEIRPDVIIHLAAYGRNLNCKDFAARATHVNVGGTLNILSAAFIHGVPRVVVCSSNITLSDQDTVYKRTKLAVEEAIERFASYGLSVMGIRPSNIYGKGQSRTEYQPCAFAGLDISFERDGHFTITGDGTQSRDFVHADDVAEAFLLAANSSVSGCTVDAATGKQISMNEVASLLDVPVVYTDPRAGDAKTLVSNIEPAKELLGFTARFSLEQRIFEAFPAVTSHKKAA